MLLKFSVENFLSFNEKQEFSMMSESSTRLDSHVRKFPKKKIGILKTAVAYGANASGKSNFIKAVDFAKNLITNGEDNVLNFQKHFRLKPNRVNETSSFEFELEIQGDIYAYGFDILLRNKRVSEEWLYKVNRATDKLIFNRKTKEDGNVELNLELTFSNKEEKNRINYIGLDTKPNQLFLTELCGRNVKNIKAIAPLIRVFEWIEDELIVIYPESKFRGIELFGDNQTLSEGFCKFLKLFDTGISGIETKGEVPDKILEMLPKEIREVIMKDFEDLNKDERRGIVLGDDFYAIHKDENNEIKFSKLMTVHQAEGEDVVLFDLGDESDGTQRMFDLIPALIALSMSNRTFLIDELDRSLHPLLSKKIIELFLKNSQEVNSQLIVTTHEAALLDLKLLRRDEIWFIEKNDKGESEIISLEEYKPRHDKEIRKSYLHGRYKGIPIFGNEEAINTLIQN